MRLDLKEIINRLSDEENKNILSVLSKYYYTFVALPLDNRVSILIIFIFFFHENIIIILWVFIRNALLRRF